jgi:drug/metabolite transporter (DMT)-like permease
VSAAPAPPRARLLLAFAIVYVVWGSTYLAMREAVATLPPFLMAGTRFVVAGALLAGWVAARDRPGRPTAAQWRWAGATGALLMVGGNGGVVWAEARGVPSGVVALLAASLAIWIVLLDAFLPGGRRQPPLVWVGLAVGLAGVGVLVGPSRIAGAGTVDPAGAGLVLGGSLAWAAGSLLSRGRGRPASALWGSALQMLCGGALLLALAAARGDFARVAAAGGAPSARSLAALAYLVVFGSLVGFTAYVWLLQHAAPAKVATYAYVNPLVAVALGWALGGEPLAARTLVAAAVIVGGVALITAGRSRA